MLLLGTSLKKLPKERNFRGKELKRLRTLGLNNTSCLLQQIKKQTRADAVADDLGPRG